MKRPKIQKDGTSVTIEFDDDRTARDYAALASDDEISTNGTTGEKMERGVKGFFDAFERVFTRFAEGATGTIAIILLGCALGFLGWHSWNGWWGPMGLAPLSIIGPVLVLAIIGLSFAIAESRVEELIALKVPDEAKADEERKEQKSYKGLRWAAVGANAVAAISFQATMMTDAETGRATHLAELTELRIERAQTLGAMNDLVDEALRRGRMSPAAQSSGRLERDIERMYRQQARNQMNEPIKGKTVADVVGDCTDPIPNWQTYYDVYCPAILDRQDELDAVTDWEARNARVKDIDAKTDTLTASMPASVGASEQAHSLLGSNSGIFMAALIAFVFGAFEFLLGQLTYHWRVTKRKKEVFG